MDVRCSFKPQGLTPRRKPAAEGSLLSRGGDGRLHGLEPGLLGLELVAHVQVHVVLEHEARVRGLGAVLLGGADERGGREDDGVGARVVEGRDGHAVAVGAREHAVHDALVPPVGDHLQLVADVGDDGVAHGRHVHPLPAPEQLQAAHLVVLEQQHDAAGVGVRAEAVDEVRARARRVRAHLGAERRAVRPREGRLQVPGLQAQVLAQQVQQPLRQLADLRCELLHHLPVAVVDVGEVGEVGGREVADEEGALPVHVLDVGALLAGLQRPGRELLELGLPEGGVVRLGQPLHLVHQLVRDAVVQQLEEAPVLAAVADDLHGRGPLLCLQLLHVHHREGGNRGRHLSLASSRVSQLGCFA
uniref:Uncharacterized protein n=1 Tax=Zea mays TaxID=4577 RepID=C0P9U6_MAIZE|nr:unknown [Zea mays]